MAAQQIERKLHLPVRRQLDFGGTLLTQQAIVSGDIDLYPEYTGTAASAVLEGSNSVRSRPCLYRSEGCLSDTVPSGLASASGF